jgi:hypothetical protein
MHWKLEFRKVVPKMLIPNLCRDTANPTKVATKAATKVLFRRGRWDRRHFLTKTAREAV